ncbi:SemiSWEET family transporter [Wolbachia endosymbiont of Anurida maritima]|uniref:SemiSWEET family sugar transporter n=1 Tax=Wolbachia endosymbiont of Anurida maritima TaxID=2850562 RepID=UPI0035CF7AF9
MCISIGKCFGFIALITSLIGLLPQVYKSYITKFTHNISMLMLVNLVICSFSWLIYGLYEGLTFIVLSNIAGLIINLTLIIQKCYYDAKSASSKL